MTVGPLQAALVEGSSPIVRGWGPVPMSAAAKGLGGFWKVWVATLLWRCVVLASLLRRCRCFLSLVRGAKFNRELRRRARDTEGGTRPRPWMPFSGQCAPRGGLKRGGGGGGLVLPLHS